MGVDRAASVNDRQRVAEEPGNSPPKKKNEKNIIMRLLHKRYILSLANGLFEPNFVEYEIRRGEAE